MACSKKNCSSCNSCCNNNYAYATHSYHGGCNSCGWNNWNHGNNWNHYNRGGYISSCGGHSGCNKCGCNSCGYSGYGYNSSRGSCGGCGCNSSRSGCYSGCDPWVDGRCGCGYNSCGGRSGCNGFGALRSISGAFSNCTNRYSRNFPFYTGPCGPCDDGCNDCCDDDCDDPCDDDCDDPCDDCDDPCDTPCDSCCDDTCHASATFSAGAPVELASGDCVVMSSGSANTNDFEVTRDGIRIHRAGAYMVIYTVHVPINERIASRFALSLNGERIAASCMDVATASDCSTNGYSMHAMLDVHAGDMLKLVSMNPVSISASSASNVFTLSLTRIP